MFLQRDISLLSSCLSILWASSLRMTSRLVPFKALKWCTHQTCDARSRMHNDRYSWMPYAYGVHTEPSQPNIVLTVGTSMFWKGRYPWVTSKSQSPLGQSSTGLTYNVRSMVLHFVHRHKKCKSLNAEARNAHMHTFTKIFHWKPLFEHPLIRKINAWPQTSENC